MGAPAKAIVEKGDDVKTGQLIARGEGFLSGNVHASVSGKVAKIDEVQDASGYKRQAVFIDVAVMNGLKILNMIAPLIRKSDLTGRKLLNRITEAGIVGLGGATFPSHVKLTVPTG